MAKSRKHIKRSVKTKRIKRGGRKDENYNPIAVTQMQGGQSGTNPSPAPTPGSGLNIYTIDTVSLRDSLQSFGDAVYAFKETAVTDVETFEVPDGLPTTPVTAGSLYALLLAQKSSADNLLTSANSVYDAFYNTRPVSSALVNGIPGGGIYRAIYGNSAIFIPTPVSPAPAPRAISGGAVGGVVPAAASGSVLNITSTANLLDALQAFGDKLIGFRTAAQAQVTQVASPSLALFQPTSDTGPAYAAFIAQQTAANDLVTAANSVLTAFAGNPSRMFPDSDGGTGPYDGVNGTRGLYRAIISNNANFVPTPP